MMSKVAKNASILLRRMSMNGAVIRKYDSFAVRAMCSQSVLRKPLAPINVHPLVMARRGVANSPQSDKELSQFLENEIQMEKQSQKKSLPVPNGWKATNDGSNIAFTKSFNGEEITVRTNVNHSVDADAPPEEQEREETPPSMVCKPDFAVEIKRGDRTLGLNCSFISASEDELDDSRAPPLEDVDDLFQINEISIFEGEFKENSYAVSGDVMDGNMYDLMMDMLHDRGVDSEFAKSLVEYSTAYEHSLYVGLLEKLKKFVSN